MVEIQDVTDAPGSGTVVASNFRGRVINSQGVAAIRGGQTLTAGFFDAFCASYANMVYHPVALFLAILGSFILLAEVYETVGPFEILAATLHLHAKTAPPIVQTIMIFLLTPLERLITYKIITAKVCLVLVPYVVKPSVSNLWILILLLFIVLVTAFSVLEIFIFANVFYLFVMIRNPYYRLLIVIIFVIITFGIFDIDTVILKLRDAHGALNVTLPP